MPVEAGQREAPIPSRFARLEAPLSTGPLSRSGSHLGRWSSVVLCCVLPVAMVVANKSAPVWLALGAILANASLIVDGRRTALWERYLPLLRSSTGQLLMAFAGLCILSLTWSIAPALTLRGLSEALPELVFGLAAAAAWPMVAKPNDLRWLAIGIAVASVLIGLESVAGLPLHRLFHARMLADDLKRSSIPPLLLLWPALLFHVRRSEGVVACALLVLVIAGGMVSHSGATVAGAVVGFTVLVAALVAPRAVAYAFAAAVVICLIVAPWTGALMDRFMPHDLQAMMDQQHAAQRILIWFDFGQHVWDDSLLGHGFDTSFRLGDISLARMTGIGPLQEEAIRGIHPHNQLLQLWIDLGLAGALFVVAALVMLLRRLLTGFDAQAVATRLGFLSCAMVVALVGVQAWDAWWLATIATSQAAFAILRNPPPSRSGIRPIR